MRDLKLRQGREVAKTLGGTETSIDQSIIDGCALITSMINYRRETGSAAEVGHDAIMSAHAALDLLGRARDQAVTCHQQLTVVRDRHGLRAEDVGCTADKVVKPTGRLRAV
jgi:hypothetical protein